MKTFTDIKRIAVLGAGTMGPGIAITFAESGYLVVMQDISDTALDLAQNVVQKAVETLHKEGYLDANTAIMVQQNISYTSDLKTAVSSADIIFEAITEKLVVKESVYQQLNELCPPDTIIASNTSYLNIFEIMPAARLPYTVIAHWFAPPHLVPLVEVVRGEKTDDETMRAVLELLDHAGKVAIRIEKYIPGFIINRIQRIMNWELYFLIDNAVITPEQLDKAVKASLMPRGMVLGIAQRCDFGGLDLTALNLENPNYLEPTFDKHPTCLYDLVDAGHYGAKTGKGFYDYSQLEMTEALSKRDRQLLKAFAMAKEFIKDSIV